MEGAQLIQYEVSVGIIGCGAIAREVLTRLQLMKHRVLVYDPYVSAEDVAALGAEKVETLLVFSTKLFFTRAKYPATKHSVMRNFLQPYLMGRTLSIPPVAQSG